MTVVVQEPEWDSLLDEVSKEYYKLILIIGETGTGKTKLLKEIGSSYGFAHINLGEELSRELSVHPIHLRSVEADEIASRIIRDTGTSRVAIDNTEILFEYPIQMDPLRFFKKQSLNKTIVANWRGKFSNREITYGSANHSSYSKYPLTDQDTFRILDLSNSST